MSGLAAAGKLSYLLGRVRFRLARAKFSLAETAGEFSLRTLNTVPRNLRNLYIFQLNYKANHTFTPQIYGGKLTYFQGSDRLRQDPQAFWSEVAGGGVEIHLVPGRSIGLFREPNVRSLAEALRAAIDKAQAEGSAG